jgi:hypothetical protein
MAEGAPQGRAAHTRRGRGTIGPVFTPRRPAGHANAGR